jgi:hypothetical protein
MTHRHSFLLHAYHVMLRNPSIGSNLGFKCHDAWHKICRWVDVIIVCRAGGPSYREEQGGALRLDRGAGRWERFPAFRVGLLSSAIRSRPLPVLQARVKGSGQECSLHTGRGCVGVLRLRSCFASRSGYSAQDDISPMRWAIRLRRAVSVARLATSRKAREVAHPGALGFSSPRDGFAGFLVGGAAALGFSFVPELFAFG